MKAMDTTHRLRSHFLLLMAHCTVLFAQAQNYSPPTGPLYQEYFVKMAYFDSLHAFTPDSIFYHEGGEYAEFQKWFNKWEGRLSPSGDFEPYDQITKNYADRQRHVGSASRSNDVSPWLEIGPTRKSGIMMGIGPIRNGISISTATPDHMLCASTTGGLFYTTDGANQWQNAGSDTHWPHSGCSGATYYPNTTNQWYAVSSYDRRISYVGGVYRTYDGPENWDLTPIADYSNLNGPNTRINKILFDQKDIGNDHRLFIATDNGLYYSDNPSSAMPTWSFVTANTPNSILAAYPTGSVDSNHRFYDIEYLPYDPQNPTSMLCASVMYTILVFGQTKEIWRYMVSMDNGATWSEIINPPAIDEMITAATVETSAAAPSKFYCLALKSSNSWVKAYNTNTNAWTDVATGFATGFGAGNGFGVDPSNPNTVFVSSGTGLRKYTNGMFSTVYTTHVDIENVAGNPLQPNIMWVAHHGGIDKLTMNGGTTNCESKSDGLGVAEIWSMSTSQNKPDYIALGLFHDGEIITRTPYSNGWNPDWGLLGGGDGTMVIINPKDANNVYNASQAYPVNSYWRRYDHAETTINSADQAWSIRTQYYARAALNRDNTDHLYGTEQVLIQGVPPADPIGNYENEIWRSFNKGGTRVIVSDFAHNYNLTRQTQGSYDWNNEMIWWIMSNPANNHHLYTGIRNWAWQSRIMRNTNIDGPNAQAVMEGWEEVPHPRRVDLNTDDDHRQPHVTGIAFDPDDENTIFLSYASSHFINPVDNWGPYASRMVYRLDVSDLGLYPDPDEYPFECGGGIPCADITMNLPNTITDLNSLCYEQGSDGGIYIATEAVIYFTNNKRIAQFDPLEPQNPDDMQNTTGWVRVGDGLPHVTARGLEINYQVNRIRVGLLGRGVWEHSLHCPEEWAYAETGMYTSDKFLEAQDEISSDAELPTGLKVNYRAGTKVHLTPGFHASAGTRFHAFIHPCDAPGNSMQPKMAPAWNNPGKEKPRLNDGELEVFPNPSDGMITIHLGGAGPSDVSQVQLYDMLGQTSLETTMNGDVLRLHPVALHGVYTVVRLLG